MIRSGKIEKIKICQFCLIIKSRDISHCYRCNECTLLHSHHCDIFETCIAGNNYFHYISFLVSYFLISIIESYKIIEYCINIIENIESNLNGKFDQNCNNILNTCLYNYNFCFKDFLQFIGVPFIFISSFVVSIIFSIILIKTIFVIRLFIYHIPSFLIGIDLRSYNNFISGYFENLGYNFNFNFKFLSFSSRIARLLRIKFDKILMNNLYIYDNSMFKL